MSHLLGFSYAPRFKNLKRQRLYIFRNRKGVDRSAWKIKPAGYADDEIVIQQWDEILRLIATIKLKEVTASDLFRRLNSYSKQHALYRALKAFGQVPKSLFILRVIDDPVLELPNHGGKQDAQKHRQSELRQAIEKQLDRIEHVHRFNTRRLGRQSAGISGGGERGPGDGRSLQAAHQELHHLLELCFLVEDHDQLDQDKPS